MDEGIEEILEEPFFGDVVLRRVTLLEFLACDFTGLTDVKAVFAEVVLVSLSSLDRPGSDVRERGSEVAECDGNEVGVEDVDGECREYRSQSNTVESGVDTAEHTDVTTLEQLSEGQLEHHHGETQEEESEQVGDEEDTTTPFVAEVRETPEVTETDSGSNSSKNEGD